MIVEVYNYNILYYNNGVWSKDKLIRVIESNIDKIHAETTFTIIDNIDINNNCRIKEITIPYAIVESIEVYSYNYDTDENIIIKERVNNSKNIIKVKRGVIRNKRTNFTKK